MANTRFSWTAVMIFVALITVSGFALNQAGYWENPLQRFMNNPGEQRGFPPTSEASTSQGEQNRGMPGGERGESGGKNNAGFGAIEWSHIGSVLFNLWFLFAATAFVILAARPIGFIVKTLHRTPLSA